MSTKLIRKPHKKAETHYSGEFLLKLRSADDLLNSLSAGSKNRLKSYMKDLCVSRGDDMPLFDSALKDLLLEYAYNRENMRSQIDYLNKVRDKNGYLFSRNLKIYSDTQEAMERFAAADHPSFRWNRNYQQTLEGLIRLVSNCHLRPERYESDDDIMLALPKLDTHSGYYYIESGKKKKGDNITGIIHKFKGRKKLVRSGKKVRGRPVLIAFRTQASGEFNDDGTHTNTCKHKTRVVSMFDLLDVIDECQFANPFQEWMNLQNFYSGGKSENQIAAIISSYSVAFPKFMSVDYSSYDQTISSWLIEDAFKVIRAAFNLTPGQEMDFDAVVDRFIHKDFVLNEGIVHSDKGVPSGSRFTQIIDSIVNVLVVNTYFTSIGRNTKMTAMGDDNIIFCDSDVDIEHLASYIQKNFGLIIKTDDKSNEGPTRGGRPKYLSRYWLPGGCWRHPHQLISRMLFPERWRDYSQEVKPEHVLFAYILTYKLGMCELINVPRFMREHPISRSFVEESVGSHYVPGSFSYIREYASAC